MKKLRILPLMFICGLVSAPTFADLITVGGPGSQGLAQVFDLTLTPTSQANIFDLTSTPSPGGGDGSFDDFQTSALSCVHGCSLSGTPIPIDPQAWGTLDVKFTNGTNFVGAEVSPVFDGEVRLIALNSSGNVIDGCDGEIIGGMPPLIVGSCGFATSFNPSTQFGTFQLSAPGISEVLISGSASCGGCGLPGAASVAGVEFSSVPEPGTLALFVLGVLGLGFVRRRRN